MDRPIPQPKTDIFMRLFIGDYLKSTQRLTTEQHGAYLLLTLDYWVNGPPPNDDEVLQQITGLDRARWRKHAPVLKRFFRVEHGYLRSDRLDVELVEARALRTAAQERARAAALARWNKLHDNQDAPSIPPSNASSEHDAMLGDCTSQSVSETQSSIVNSARVNQPTAFGDLPLIHNLASEADDIE